MNIDFNHDNLVTPQPQDPSEELTKTGDDNDFVPSDAEAPTVHCVELPVLFRPQLRFIDDCN